jgi:hypothetical protein
MRRFLGLAQFDSSSFEAALKSGNEVMIHGKYILTPLDMAADIVHERVF